MHRTDDGGALALIAGGGNLPREAARLLRAQGQAVSAIGFSGLTDSTLEDEVDEWRSLRLGQLEALAEALHDMHVTRLLLVGTVSKSLLHQDHNIADPDAEAIRLLSRENDQRDEPLMLAIAGWLEGRGFRLCDQGEVLASMLAPAGSLTRRAPGAAPLGDLAFGWPIVRDLGRAGIGQCVVVKQGSVLAVEAIEGTDAAIRRAGALGGSGATVIKAARPDQDRRFDLPAVGVGTIEAMCESGASALAIEALSTLVLDRERMIEAADRENISVWGFVPDQEGS
jgi:DUF1009 family protein